LCGALSHIAICEQAERRGAARVVTDGAVLEEDRRNTVERNLALRRGALECEGKGR
jgi:hypothetical protein